MKTCIKKKLKDFVTSLTLGMKGAENVMFSQSGGDDNKILIVAKKEQGGTLAEALKKAEVTQEVMDIRYRTYMIDEESHNYEVLGIGDEDGEAFSISVEFNKPKVDETEEDYEVIIVQTSEEITTGIKEGLDRMEKYGIPSEFPLKIEREYTSRFPIEKNCHQLVVKQHKENKNVYQLDFYCTIYPNPIDRIKRIFTNEAEKLYKDIRHKTDLNDFVSVRFVSNKTWGVKNNREFKYKILKHKNSSLFDGYYVFKFNAEVLINGKSLIEKYYSKNIADKYDKNEARPNKEAQFNLFGEVYNKPHYCEVCEKEMAGLEKHDWEITKELYDKGLCQKCLSEHLYKDIKNKLIK